MSYTINDAVIQARDIVQDAAGPNFRHSDEKFMRYFNDAMADVRRLRGDLFLATINDPWVQYDITNFADPFPIDYTYFTSVVDYLVSMIGIGDDEFSLDGRADKVHKRFITKLTGKFA